MIIKQIFDLIQQTIVIAPPILITAVGACISERSGIVNIGLEGIMLSSAFATAVANITTGNPYLGIIFGVIVGVLISLIHAVISINLKGNQIISGVAINLFAVAVTSFLIKALYNTAGSTPMAKDSAGNPILANQPLMLIIIYAIAILTHFFLYKTVLGLRIRTVGEHPLAADTVGISVYKIRYISVLLSGALAGLGGAYLTAVLLPSFSNNMSAGRGYIAMAAMIFGKWNPIGAMLSSLFFGLSQSLAVIGGQLPFLSKIPTVYLQIAPYALTILVLAVFFGQAVAPKADGINYIKSK